MTTTTRSTRYVVPRLTALVALGVLALAACGGSSYGGSAATQPSASNKPAAASGSAVATGQTDVGTVLVDQNGKTLYAFAADAKNHSNCSGSCAQYWPPVTWRRAARQRRRMSPRRWAPPPARTAPRS